MTVPLAVYPVQLSDQPVIYRGEPFSWKLSMSRADGSAVDLTAFGPTWASSLRTSMDSATSVDFAVDTSHLAAGYVVLSLSAAQTSAMHRGSSQYGFDVQASGGSVTPFTVWRGTVSVDGDYTR